MSSSAKRMQKLRKDQTDEEVKAERARNAQRNRDKRAAEKNAKMKDSKNLDQRTSLESSSLSHGPDDSGIATMNASEAISISSQCGSSMAPVRGSSRRGLRKGSKSTVGDSASRRIDEILGGGKYLRPIGFEKLAMPNEKSSLAKPYSYWKNKLIQLGKEAKSKPYAVDSQEYQKAFEDIIIAEKRI